MKQKRIRPKRQPKRFSDPIIDRQYRRLYVKPALHYKHRQWEVDQDYIEELEQMERNGDAESRAALDWLSKFLGEYYHNTGIPATPNPNNPALHSTTELRRDCYNRTNRAHRDLFSVKHATGWLDHEQKQELGITDEEDLMILSMDAYFAYRNGKLSEDEYEIVKNMIAEDRELSRIVLKKATGYLDDAN